MGNSKIKMIVKVSILFVLGLGVFIYVNIASKNETTRANNEVNKTEVTASTKAIETKTSNTGYNPSTEEKKVLAKHYADMTYDDLQVLEKLEKTYDSLNDEGKATIKSDIERIRNERTKIVEENKKIIEENRKTYSELISEIEKDYPGMKVSSISGKSENKTIDIDMQLLHNITSTEEQACTLAVMKETKMKEAGIKDVVIFVNDSNSKDHGILAFQLTNGQYKPHLNTIN